MAAVSKILRRMRSFPQILCKPTIDVTLMSVTTRTSDLCICATYPAILILTPPLAHTRSLRETTLSRTIILPKHNARARNLQICQLEGLQARGCFKSPCRICSNSPASKVVNRPTTNSSPLSFVCQQTQTMLSPTSTVDFRSALHRTRPHALRRKAASNQIRPNPAMPSPPTLARMDLR